MAHRREKTVGLCGACARGLVLAVDPPVLAARLDRRRSVQLECPRSSSSWTPQRSRALAALSNSEAATHGRTALATMPRREGAWSRYSSFGNVLCLPARRAGWCARRSSAHRFLLSTAPSLLRATWRSPRLGLCFFTTNSEHPLAAVRRATAQDEHLTHRLHCILNCGAPALRC
eukprot:COSAG06_NODE_1758_length_8454_cov_102.821664_1_plen_174_part_00